MTEALRSVWVPSSRDPMGKFEQRVRAYMAEEGAVHLSPHFQEVGSQESILSLSDSRAGGRECGGEQTVSLV